MPLSPSARRWLRAALVGTAALGGGGALAGGLAGLVRRKSPGESTAGSVGRSALIGLSAGRGFLEGSFVPAVFFARALNRMARKAKLPIRPVGGGRSPAWVPSGRAEKLLALGSLALPLVGAGLAGGLAHRQLYDGDEPKRGLAALKGLLGRKEV